MNQRGFTLIEALVAVTIIVIGILGPLMAASRGISDGLFAQNQITANFLAQEALEATLGIRNTNVLTFQPNVFAGLDSGTYGLDSRDNSLYSCSSDCGLKYEGGKYIPANGEAALFNRIIEITGSDEEPKYRKITVTISWLNKILPQSISMFEYLYGN